MAMLVITRGYVQFQGHLPIKCVVSCPLSSSPCPLSAEGAPTCDMFSEFKSPFVSQLFFFATLVCGNVWKFHMKHHLKINFRTKARRFPYLAVCQNLVPLVNIKIAGKWDVHSPKNGINRYWSIPIYVYLHLPKGIHPSGTPNVILEATLPQPLADLSKTNV